jgi:hypothetical protein
MEGCNLAYSSAFSRGKPAKSTHLARQTQTSVMLQECAGAHTQFPFLFGQMCYMHENMMVGGRLKYCLPPFIKTPRISATITVWIYTSTREQRFVPSEKKLISMSHVGHS